MPNSMLIRENSKLCDIKKQGTMKGKAPKYMYIYCTICAEIGNNFSSSASITLQYLAHYIGTKDSI